MIIVNAINAYTAIVSGLKPEQKIMLNNFLAVKIPGSNFSRAYNEYNEKGQRKWDGFKRFYSTITNKFPIYFKDQIIKFLESHELEVSDNTKKIITLPEESISKVNLQGIELLDYQLDCCKKCISAGHGIIESPTSSGKTVIIASIVQMFDKKTLILVDRKSLAEQIKKRFSQYGIGDIDIIHSENADFKDRKIAVCLVQSIKEIEGKLMNYELLIVDEVHKAKSKGFIEIVKKCKNAYNRFGFSATIQSPDTPEGLTIIAGYGKKVFKIPALQLIERGDIMADPTFFMINIEKDPLYMADSMDKIPNENKYVEIENKYYVYNLYRNALIAYITKKHIAKGEKVLILVRRREHGKVLEQMLGTEYIFGDHKIEAREDAIKSFENGDTPILLAQSEIMGTGIDLAGGCDAMIIGSGGKGEIGVVQKVGRGMRKNTNMKVSIYDFYDNMCYDTLSHSKKRKNIITNVYSSNKLHTIDIDVDNKIYNKVAEFTKKN